jgi:hypothetical protein
MPCEPLLNIVLALVVPVTIALGTIGAGPSKHHAADPTTEEKGCEAQSSSQAEMDFVAIYWSWKKPDSNSHDNTGD